MNKHTVFTFEDELRDLLLPCGELCVSFRYAQNQTRGYDYSRIFSSTRKPYHRLSRSIKSLELNGIYPDDKAVYPGAIERCRAALFSLSSAIFGAILDFEVVEDASRDLLERLPFADGSLIVVAPDNSKMEPHCRLIVEKLPFVMSTYNMQFGFVLMEPGRVLERMDLVAA